MKRSLLLAAVMMSFAGGALAETRVPDVPECRGIVTKAIVAKAKAAKTDPAVAYAREHRGSAPASVRCSSALWQAFHEDAKRVDKVVGEERVFPPKARKQADPDGPPVQKQPGPIQLGSPAEHYATKASGKKFDLRSLPFVPPVKRERPEREAPPVTPVGTTAVEPTLAPFAAHIPSVTQPNAPAPAPIATFDGLDFANWGAGHPPDTNGDVGPAYYIQTINTSIGVFRKSDGVRVAAFTFDTFMSQGAFGNLCDTDNFGDPVVLYDSFEDRWIITDFAFQLDGSNNVINPPGSFQCFAVSMNGDPVTGGWNYYSINTTGGLGDYPKFGIWPDGLYMSANMFDYAASGSFQNSRLYAFNKTQMYAGSPTVKVVSFNLPSDQFTVLPANARLQTGTPPAGSPNYFASVWNFLNSIQIWKFHVDWNNVPLSTVTGPFSSTMGFWWEQYSGTNGDAPTPANSLDTLYPRLMVQNQYANIGGVESLWDSHSVGAGNPTSNLSSAQAAIRYYQVNVTGGTVAANTTQSFTYSPDTTIFRYMPSVAVNRAGDMAIGYTTSNATTNPGIKYAGRLAGDAANSITLTEQTMFQGTGSQSGNCGTSACTRWGDYSAMTIDPDGCTFWYTNEYYAANGLSFLTRIGYFKYGTCTPVGAGGTVSGTVTAAVGGAVIGGATVSLGARTTTTNSSGVYSFTGIPAGTYPTLSAAYVGYTTSTTTSIPVTDGGTTTRNFSLSAASSGSCLVDTSQADFNAASQQTNVDVTSSPGDVKLAKPDLIDQSNSTVSPTGFGFTNTSWAGQTFTAGISGQLTRADVELFCSACTATSPNITVSIRATSGGAPTGADLATATIAGFNDGGAGGLKTATFATPMTVTAGTKYAVIFRLAAAFGSGTMAYTCSCQTTGFTNSNPYANGQRVTSTNSGTTWSTDNTAGGRDLHFVVYVNAGFASSGDLISSLKDANPAVNNAPAWSTLSWTATTPASTGVKFQVAASSSANGPFSFVGPDGTAATFFTTSGASIAQFNGKRYLEYHAYLTSTNTAATPTLSDVTVCFADAACAGSAPTITATPATVCPSATGRTASGPAGMANYSWGITNGTITSGFTSQSITYTAGASGSVVLQLTTTDGTGCVKASTLSVPVDTVPTPTISSSGTTFCGSGTLTSSAASGNQWYVGGVPIGAATNTTYTATASGSYTVRVTDANGCTSAMSAATVITVNPNPATPTITPSGATTFCAGGSVTLTAPSGFTYSWSTGATTQSISATTSGSYTVTVTNGNGCSATSAATVVTVNPNPATPTITPSGATTFCTGGSVTLTAPSGFTYSWSTGATTQSIIVSTSGSYTVTVTNGNGCSATSAATTVTVNPNPATPTITPSGSTTFCAGGSVTLTAPSGFTYSWSTGATTQSINATSSGSYTVTVTNGNGCSATSAATAVTVNPNPATPVITANGPTTFCAGGSVTLSAPTGFTYSWSNAATTQSIVVTTSGSYTVTVTDGNGCSATSAATVVTVTPGPATPTITPSGATTFCAGGSVTLSAPNGYTYSWSTGATTQTINVSTSGSYTVTVTDGNGCSATSAATVVTVNPNPPTPAITPSGSTTFCAGGSVTLSAPSGFTYSWSTGATTQSIIVSASGSYTVTVTNGNGCSATSAATTVTVNPNPATPTITPSGSTTFCAGGSVTLSAPNGFTYSWSTGATTQSIIVTSSGSYTVTVTNGNGCSATSAATLVTVNPNPPTPAITPSGATTFCAGGSVTLSAPIGYTYSWSTGATTQTINVSSSGSYTVTVTDGNGCSATSAATTVTVNPNPATPVITADGPTTFCAGGSVTLSAPTGFTYSWSNAATTQSIVVTTSGSYTVTVTDGDGCSATSAATVVTVTPGPATPAITPSGATTFCAGGSVTLSAPDGYTYSWSTSATTQTINVTSSGSYTVTVTDGNGCSATSAATVVTVNPNPPTPAITPSGATTFCAGGSVTLSAPNGYTYSWSTGATTQTIHVSSSGSYTVTVTDGNGCSAISAATVVTVNPNPPTPAITPSGATTFCVGGNVTLSAPNGYTYSWSTGATTQSINVSTSGSFSVTVTDGNGCSATSAATVVTVNPNPPTPAITPSGATTFCAGGSVILSAPNGYTYAWSTGATTQSINVGSSGSYSVTVTDGNGCSATSAATIVTVNPNPLTPAITPSGATTFCAGGSVTLSAPNGYTYSWSTGVTTQTIDVTSSGSFTVTVTDGNGCSATSAATAVTVNPNPATPVITADGPTTFCAGGSVTLSAPTGFTYSWSNAATTQSIVVTASGSYSVTVTDANGCSATSAATVVTVNSGPATPAITPSGATTFCTGGNVTLSAPDGYTYLWSNSATTQSINVTTSGSYTVTVTDGNGCSATSAATVVTVNPNPPTPTITPSGSTTFCAGGSVTLSAPNGYTYSWSTGATTQTINVSSSGSYTVTVTDGNGCSAISAATVVTVNPNPPTPAITPGGSTTFCAGGSVILSAPNGYTYAWSTGATTQSINVASSGAYSVTVTDGNGCSATSAATIVTVNPNPPTPAITPSGATTFCAGGSVTLSAPNGYTYSWSTGATTQTINVSSSGSYTVTVTDGNGCSATSAATAVTVNPNPATPVVTADGPTTFCAGGSVTLSAPTGFTYSWSNAATTQSIVVTASGSYTVTVTDGNGCSATSAATVVTVTPGPATPTITPSGATTFCAGGSVTLTAPDGFTYSWSNSATTQAINVTTSGSYTVTITDGNGCSATSAATVVTVNSNPATPTITPSGSTTFCAGGSVTLSAPNGFTYSWSTGATTQSINVSTAGSYSVTVTDGNGCSATSAATVVTVNPNPPTPAITPSGATTFCAGGSVTLSAPNGYTYSWSTGATTQTINVSASGSYSVTVTDGNGCSATSAATAVTVNPNPPTPAITPSGATTFCAGGSVTLSAPNGYTYSWSTGATTQTINVSASGSYSVTVTDGNGCVATSAATVVTVNPNPPTPAITPSGSTTFCAGGSVTLNAPNGFTYSWSTGATTQSINVATAASYTVTVTDGNGCSATSAATTVTVNPNPATPTITPSGSTTFCAGGSVTLTAPTGFTYSWSTGATTQSINVTSSGSYTVTVANGNGCSATSAATTVTVNSNPATPTITPSGSTTFCAGGSVTLTAPSGFTYSWSTGATTQSINVTSAGSYTVTVTNGNGCSATSAATTVTVNPNPATPAITPSGSTTFCAGGSVTLTAPAGFTYSWSTGATTQSINVTSSGSYTVTVTNGNGCSATSAATTVTVNPLPNATISVVSTIAAGASGSASVANAGSGATYNWSITNGTITSGNGTNAVNFTAGAAGTLTLNVTVTTAAGCSDSKSANVTVTAAAPAVTVTSVTPHVGRAAGGTSVTIAGTGFQTGATVTFGGAAATNVVRVSATSITATTPAHAVGSVNVTVTNPDSSSGTLNGGFTYVAQQFDPNGDGTIDPADIFYLVNYLFTNGPAPAGAAGMLSGDANGDGVVDPADIFYVVNYLFTNGPAPFSLPAQALSVSEPISGSITLGDPVVRNGHTFVPVIVTATPGTRALSLRVRASGADVVAIRRAGAARDVQPIFEITRPMTYLVSFASDALAGTVAEIEIVTTPGVAAELDLDPALTLLADQAGRRKATAGNSLLRLSGTKLGGRPRPDHNQN